MIKSNRFLTSVLVALVVALFSVACGGGDDESSSPSPVPTTATPVAQATEVPSTSAVQLPTPAPPTPIAPTSGPPLATAIPATVIAPTSVSAPVPTTGKVEVRVTDAPPDGVLAIWLTITDLEAKRSGSDDSSGWMALISEPRTFDLVQLIGVEEILGTSELELGEYTQIRMTVSEATVTLNENGQPVDREATVPSDKLRVVGGFTVSADDVTVLTLDFDADKSVIVTGNGSVKIKPVVKLLVRKSGESFVPEVPSVSDASTVVPVPTSIPVPTATNVPATTATPLPTATPVSTATLVPTAIPVPTATHDAFGEALFLDILAPIALTGEEIAYVDVAEVLIVGRSRIDATVTVGDDFVELDEDGRFEVLVTLDAGVNLIEVVASVSTGEEVSTFVLVSNEAVGG